MSLGDYFLLGKAIARGCVFAVPLVVTPAFREAVLSAMHACRN